MTRALFDSHACVTPDWLRLRYDSTMDHCAR